MPRAGPAAPGTVPGPDVIVGELSGLAQFGSAVGTQVGLAVGTDSCNAGVENLELVRIAEQRSPRDPTKPLSNERRAQQRPIALSRLANPRVKHAFTALTQNICGFGCNGVGGSQLGSGCSDPYSAGLNAGPNLGSRAWINPFTGFFPRGDSPNTSKQPYRSCSHRPHTAPDPG